MALFCVNGDLPTMRIGLQYSVGIGDVIRGPADPSFQPVVNSSRRPARSVKLRAQLDNILDIPGAEAAAPAQFIRIRHHLETLVTVPCKKVVKLAKAGFAQLTRGGVFIILEALEPDAKAIW